MPEPNDYGSKEEFMAVCIPKLIEEGKPQDQAAVICNGMWEDKSVKRGARNNRLDQERIQDIHDMSVANGALCDMPQEAEDKLIYFGSPVKAIKLDDGSVKFSGYLITFGDENNTDLTGDYFTPGTYFGPAEKSDGYFNHRMPVYADNLSFAYTELLGQVDLKKDDRGVLAEIIMKAHDEYEEAIIAAGLAGKLGWSSGTAPHLVDREPAASGKAWHVKRWPLGADASLTPTPAEPKNMVVSLKSISVPQRDDAAQVKREGPEEVKTVKSETKQEITKMEITEDKLQDIVTQAAEAGAKKAIADLPEPIKKTDVVQVTLDEGDREFKTLAEQCQAVKNFYTSLGRNVHPRILGLQAKEAKAIQGASESIPQDGGVLLEPTLLPSVILPIHEEGVFSADAKKLPVGNNSNSGWINGIDETSRATGSRWGGIRGYRLAEGDTLTKSKPAFRRIQWELKKYGCLVYDTNELLKDASQFNAIVQQACREEISFMLNDDIMNGLGVSGPQGVMNSGALITVTRDTGSAILGTDISAMWQRLLLRSKANAKWYVNSECAPQLDKLFAVGSTAVLFPYAGYRPDGVRTLYGRPVVETEFNAALNTTGDIMLADMSQYLLWEKGGVDYATSMHVEFLTDQEVLRFIYRADGKSSVASPLTPYKGTATHSPYVVLGSAT